jgi:patatin-related protein
MTVDHSREVSMMTQELRLATTMTGGVSLAIWMAGVAREINLLAQASEWRRAVGRDPRPGILTGPAKESLTLYRQLIDLLDLVVDVDILSGTSAGGINGVLLAWSRVRRSDLGKLREIWMTLGALTELLRDPTDKTTPSLLYGDEHMLSSLVAKIPTLTDGPFAPQPAENSHQTAKLDPPSTTLYVTTTLLNGETSRFTDSFGTLVQDVDRRGLFTFTESNLAKKRDAAAEERTVEALALAARSSASFPAAFEPSFVPFSQGTPKKGKVPARPPMENFANITRSHWVADGGLLDNQPINVVLKRIFDQPAERPVRRVLLFVVPSSGPAPNPVEEPEPDEVDEPLGLIGGLAKDLTAVTTQSIAADLRALRDHQDRMEARTDARLRLAELAIKLPNSQLLSAELLADYKKREATKQAQEITSAVLRQLGTWPPESTTTNESIPKNWEAELIIGGNAEKACRTAITKSILEHWLPSPQPPRHLQDLARYGRAAFDLAKACAISVVAPAYELARSPRDFESLAILSRGIHESYTPAPFDLAQIVRDVCIQDANRGLPLEYSAAKIARNFLRVTAVPADAWRQLGAAFVSANQTLTNLSEGDLDPAAAARLRLYLKYLDSQGDSFIEATKLFDLAAAQRAMLPAGADVDQSVELVQVSADTRSLLAPKFETAQQKLTGMQLHHFGAFYKQSWRANDWMWGRLDGAGWLVHVLLDPRRIRSIVERREDEDGDENGAEWFLSKLESFGAPGLPDSTRADLLKELAFLNNPATPPPPSIPETALWLAQVWQQRVLDDELTELAKSVTDPKSKMPRDWSPPESILWAQKVLAADQKLREAKQKAETPAAATQAQPPQNPRDADDEAVKAALREFYGQLDANAVAEETFDSDRGSPLMACTITKAAATASAAVASAPQVPKVVKPALTTLRTVTLAAYRVVSATKGCAKRFIQIGAALLVLGIAFAIQSTSWAGLLGLTMIAVGSYLLVLGTWQRISARWYALLSILLVLLAVAPSFECVATWLFGKKGTADSSLVGGHLYWLSEDWTHPLIVEGVFVLAVIVVGVATTNLWRVARRRLRRRRRSRSSSRKEHSDDRVSAEALAAD